MLELKHVKKYYQVGDTVTKALDDVSIAFRPQEFVAVLGPSGSGKTTLLNALGGLDRYDSGDMIVNGTSTKKFKETDWDAYRNNTIGFIFQSYNLIGHLSILDNVEMGMTLSGVSKAQRKEKAVAALKRVGLGQHMNKAINQLSGGQMQRVAIARAIVNDPDVLLCDEPTGALDTETSAQIMQIIQELSRERLVIMVTHNPDLANQYADRVVEFVDGKIQRDTNPYHEKTAHHDFQLKRTKMTFATAIKLSFKNIRTKKGRTFLTAFASSIGIIGVAIVLSLSNGFQKQIDDTQTQTLAKFPVTISQVATDQTKAQQNMQDSDQVKPNKGYVVAAKDQNESAQHVNRINQKFLDYVHRINPEYSNNIGYTRLTGMNLLRKINGKVKTVKFSNSSDASQDLQKNFSSVSGVGVSSFPEPLKSKKNNFLEANYKLLKGAYPQKATDVVVVVNGKNQTNVNALKNLGFDIKDGEKINLNQLIGTSIKVANNDDYYQKLPTGNFVPKEDLTSAYQANQTKELKIVGVIRAKQSSNMDLLAPGIAYSDKLVRQVIKDSKASAIVQAQRQSNRNVITGEAVSGQTKDQLLATLGGDSMPYSILIYPNNFKDKEKVLNYLDRFNEGKTKQDKIIYTDLAGTMTDLTGGLMDAITYVLVAFAGISLITSMIMIGILTYTSVLERTKEIGVLKALGARKKDITRVFDAETGILGVASGVLGVLIAYLATFPINSVLYHMTDLTNVAQLNPVHAVILVIVSTVLTMIGGHLPARMASKKDAAIALRSE